MQSHAVLGRLVTSFAVLPGLGDHIAILIDGHSDEALVAGEIATLRVRVDEAIFLPLTEAAVLALFVHFAAVVAVKHSVKHHFGVVAVGVGLGAQALGVGQHAGVFPDERTMRWLLDIGAAERLPLGRAEVADVA